MVLMTAEQLAERAKAATAAKAKLDSGAQLTLDDVKALRDPADVQRAMNAGQLTDLGFGAARSMKGC